MSFSQANCNCTILQRQMKNCGFTPKWKESQANTVGFIEALIMLWIEWSVNCVLEISKNNLKLPWCLSSNIFSFLIGISHRGFISTQGQDLSTIPLISQNILSPFLNLLKSFCNPYSLIFAVNFYIFKIGGHFL